MSSVAAAEAAREVALVAVSECSIRAPRDGYVEDLYYEQGELVAPGAALLRLVDLTDVRATILRCVSFPLTTSISHTLTTRTHSLITHIRKPRPDLSLHRLLSIVNVESVIRIAATQCLRRLI